MEGKNSVKDLNENKKLDQEAHPGPCDSCPEWARLQIDQLLEVEIFLGNIPRATSWKSEHVNDVSKKSFSDHNLIDEKTADLVFKRIVHKLAEEDFNTEQIALFINNRIGYKGGPAYCNQEEIIAALT